MVRGLSHTLFIIECYQTTDPKMIKLTDQMTHPLAPHFTSWHGLLGFITAILIVVQALAGGLMGFEWSRRLLLGETRARSLWRYHRCAPSFSRALLTSLPPHRPVTLKDLSLYIPTWFTVHRVIQFSSYSP